MAIKFVDVPAQKPDPAVNAGKAKAEKPKVNAGTEPDAKSVQATNKDSVKEPVKKGRKKKA